MLVTATKQATGWDLVLGDGRRTSVRTLEGAESHVRAYLDTCEPGVDHSDVDVTVDTALGDVLGRVRGAQAASEAAQAATIDAARMMRDVVRELRGLGLSVTDIAYLLGITRGRVSQITERDRFAERARKRRGAANGQ